MEEKKLPLGTIYQAKSGGNHCLRYQIQGKRKNVNLKTDDYDEALKECHRLLPTLQATTVEVVAAHVKNARQLEGRMMRVALGHAWEKIDRAMPATVNEHQGYQTRGGSLYVHSPKVFMSQPNLSRFRVFQSATEDPQGTQSQVPRRL